MWYIRLHYAWVGICEENQSPWEHISFEYLHLRQDMIKLNDFVWIVLRCGFTLSIYLDVAQ